MMQQMGEQTDAETSAPAETTYPVNRFKLYNRERYMGEEGSNV
ncbi:hypothetical protein Q0F98_37300 [Paenibacillus amylolyticus]|nr:hypothetical protein Q0F98_37300 [Paenibacillus amylolyticus]